MFGRAKSSDVILTGSTYKLWIRFNDLAVFFGCSVPIATSGCDRQIKFEQFSHTLITLCEPVIELLFEHSADGRDESENGNEGTSKLPAAIFHLRRGLREHLISTDHSGFGTAQLGGRLFANRSRDAFYLSALRSALEIGYTHFDTANFYSFGHAEELIGRAVRETNTKRENIFITTKVWPTRLTYNKVLRACENSLRRLQTEYIDLYLVHWPNPLVPLKALPTRRRPTSTGE